LAYSIQRGGSVAGGAALARRVVHRLSGAIEPPGELLALLAMGNCEFQNPDLNVDERRRFAELLLTLSLASDMRALRLEPEPPAQGWPDEGISD
jgi:hypothetical protein